MAMPKKILMIEDDTSLQEVLREFMVQYDINIQEANDSQQGFEMLEEDTYDAILLDIMLPSKSGFGVCKEIRKTNDIPIIMLTARGEVIDLGADDYISKPFEPCELLARLQAIMRRGRRLEQNSSKLFGVPTICS